MRKYSLYFTFISIAISIFVNCEKNPTENTVKIPEVTTDEVVNIIDASAECRGTVTSDGGSSVYDRGVCWSTSQTPTISDSKTTQTWHGTGSFTCNIRGLLSEATYYVRAYAKNSAGTGYGSVLSFTTEKSPETVTDSDGNIYQTVKIGDQLWMAENLKVTRYRDGTPIPNITDNTEWGELKTGAYCNYNNSEDIAATYGRLYNWYAVNNSHNIAPEGWHIPTKEEWQTLVDYLGGILVAGCKMKETGTTHWWSPNFCATNESGFTALPGGNRGDHETRGEFHDSIGRMAAFWSSSEYGSDQAFNVGLSWKERSTHSILLSDWYKWYGFSVRCIRGE